MIGLIIAYLLVLVLYFYTETSGKMSLRAPNKVLLATMFYVYAALQFTQHYELVSVHLLLMVALFLARMGDVFLLFDLNRGGDFFLCGNVCFFTYEMSQVIAGGRSFSDFWWILLTEAVLMGTFIFLANRLPNVLKFGKMKWPMMLYLSSITLHGAMGVALLLLFPGTQLAQMGLGSLFFMISDYILTVDKFVVRNNKWILRANSAFYFTGLLLIVLSMTK